MSSRPLLRASHAALAAALSVNGSTLAADFSVGSVKILQAVQFGATPLIADNATYLRVTVDYDGETPQRVDGVVHMFIDDVEVEGSPFHSVNGPVLAVSDPSEQALYQTMQFLVIPPQSEDIRFVIELNPYGETPEDDYTNNTFEVPSVNTFCRGTVELVYVPIDYQPGGLGLPDDALIEPGIGDGFVRAIYTMGEWNYHRTPTPPLVWTSGIDNSVNQLFNALEDIRLNQLPSMGYDVPTFVYGWLPGNPYSGNGAAEGAPGDVAFGNTQPTRHQRTFAHELGHLYGLSHNNSTINTVGVDIEHHLADTQGLAMVFPPTKFDIMVAGQLTNTAFVGNATYMTALNDNRSQCQPGAGMAGVSTPMLRVSGLFDTIARSASMDPVMWISRGTATADEVAGDLVIEAVDSKGRTIGATRTTSGTGLESCSGDGTFRTVVNYHLLVPATLVGGTIDRIRLRDLTTGGVLAQRIRSASAPVVTAPVLAAADDLGLEPNDMVDAPEALAGVVSVSWIASDDDGDALTYNLLYSHDGGASWVPLVVNHGSTSFTFDTADVASSDGTGVLRVVASDGLNIGIAETVGVAMGASAPPEAYLLTPNDGETVGNAEPIVLHGAAWDLEDRMLTDGITWWLEDRHLGTGPIVLFDDLPVGSHVITMRATDSDDLVTECTRSIVVFGRDVFPADADADG
ncbi:MAG: hypothetical protein ACYTGR_05075, partial [Planctomycetota bacterium]